MRERVMMRVTITGINFKYENGYDQEYTSVELQFITSGFHLTNNTPVQITREQYEANMGNSNGLRALIVDRKLEEVDSYVNDLNNYKDSLLV